MREAGAKSSSVPPAEKRAVTESLAPPAAKAPQAVPFRRIDRVCLGDVRGIRRR